MDNEKQTTNPRSLTGKNLPEKERNSHIVEQTDTDEHGRGFRTGSRRPIRRILIAVSVTAFWLAMMTLLVRNQILRPRRGQPIDVTPSLLTEQWQDFVEWMRLSIGERSEGVCFSTIRRRTDGGGGYIAGNRIWVELDFGGGHHDFRIESAAHLDALFRLESATASVRLAEAQMRFAALSDGTRLFYRLQYGGETRVGIQPLEKPISLLEAVRPMAARRLDLRVGAVYRLPVFDSTWSLREGIAEMCVEALESIRVGERNVRAYRLAFQLGPFTSKTWVNREGEVLRREFANNIMMERMDPIEARKRFPGIDAPMAVPALSRADFSGDKRETSLPQEDIGPLGMLAKMLLRGP